MKLKFGVRDDSLHVELKHFLIGFTLSGMLEFHDTSASQIDNADKKHS